jgi:hypothetical protein
MIAGCVAQWQPPDVGCWQTICIAEMIFATATIVDQEVSSSQLLVVDCSMLFNVVR